MRLRPTQFVFVLLLLCSVQLGDDYARQLTTVAPAYKALTAQESAGSQLAGALLHIAGAPGSLLLRASVARRAPRHQSSAMTSPASSAAAVAHHTGLLHA